MAGQGSDPSDAEIQGAMAGKWTLFYDILIFYSSLLQKKLYIFFIFFFSDILREGELSKLTSRIVRTQLEEKFGVSFLGR